MSIWITGDIHGEPMRFSTDIFPEQKDMTKEDCVIICGDFGLIWENDLSPSEYYWLKWLENKPFTTLFVDGNHENHVRLNQFPVKKWNGGTVHEIKPTVLHLMRGEIYNLQGKKFFTFGGAQSHDISDGILDSEDPLWKKKAMELNAQHKYMYRIKGISWWEEELPSEKEMQNGREKLEKADWKVDYIISHDCPISTGITLYNARIERNKLNEYLEEIHQKCDYNRWLFGHHHVNKQVNEKDIALYEQIVRIV